jgi:hypothetical protein
LDEAGSPLLQLLSLEDHSLQPVASGNALPLGWTASGHLAYLSGMVFGPNGTRGGIASSSGTLAHGLAFYDALTGARLDLSQRLIQPPAFPQNPWPSDRQQLVLTLLDPRTSSPDSARIVRVDFDRDPRSLAVVERGLSLGLSPDGRWLAYVPGSAGDDAVRLRFLNLEGKATHDLLPAAGLDAIAINGFLWSPSGDWLAVLVLKRGGQRELVTFRLGPSGPGPDAVLETIPAASAQAFPVGFSADGRYLAFFNVQAPDMERRLFLLDLAAGTTQALFPGGASAAWSPSGHLLALAGPGKFLVTDPATGRDQWISGGDCAPVWYALP